MWDNGAKDQAAMAKKSKPSAERRKNLERFTQKFEKGDLPPAKEYGGVKPEDPGWLEAMCKAKGIEYVEG